MPTVDGQVLILAREITRYLIQHPNAADSVNGIHRWWLPEWWHVGTSEVQQALDLLVAEGSVQKRALPDGNAVYSARFLSHGTGSAEGTGRT